MNNILKLEISAQNQNDSFVRSTIAAFCCHLNPTLEEINDIKTAVSEAFTNAVIHGYSVNPDKFVYIEVYTDDQTVKIIIKDNGLGIADIETARKPFYTSKPEQERSGMGFTVMEMFTDELEIVSAPGKGTSVILTKKINSAPQEE